MAFSEVPNESKSQIDKAGRMLLGGNIGTDQLKEAKDLVERWRACHAYPINTFQATLRNKVKKFSGKPIVAQRLKRMPTIVDKLQRYPDMKLTRMQDIGGVRAVLDSIEDVNRLAAEYREESRFNHTLKQEKDYISNPRNQDGYRSVHLTYKYKNEFAPSYDDLLLELQIRTKLQHIWATAVETTGTLINQALKSRQGDKDWIDFFAVTSSAFAHMEDSPLVPRYKDYTYRQTCGMVAELNGKLGVLDKIKGYSIAAKVIGDSKRNRRWLYFLITLDLSERRAQIRPYTEAEFSDAAMDYAKFEEQAEKGKKVSSVLVSAGPISVLRQAYPNFFLDINDFINKVEEIIHA